MRDRVSEEIVERLLDKFVELRKAQGLSHERLSALSGVSRPMISFMESHQRVPSILVCLKIARALGVNLADVIREVSSTKKA